MPLPPGGEDQSWISLGSVLGQSWFRLVVDVVAAVIVVAVVVAVVVVVFSPSASDDDDE